MSSRFDVLAIDCAQPRRLAEFWCAVLDYVIVEDDEDGVTIAAKDAASDQPAIDFLLVPGAKTVKNRLHLDLRAVGVTQEQELARLLELGARTADVGQSPEVTWVVLRDPEGNEFCLLRTPMSGSS